MELKTQGDRVRYVRTTLRRMSQTELANRAGLKIGTLSKLERNETLQSGSITKIAEALTVSANWLATGRGEMENRNNTVSMSTDSYSEDVEVFQFACKRCSFGPNHEVSSAKILPPILFSKAVFDELNIDKKDCFSYIATDNSMSNTIQSKDRLLIDATQIRPETASGRIFAICYGDTLQFRYIHTTVQRSYRLLSELTADKNAYPDTEIDLLATPSIQIAGMVRWIAGER